MRTRPPPSSLRINLFELRNFPLNIDTELQVLKLLDSPTFQLPITECLTASELLPISPFPPHNGILPRLLLYFPAPKDYLPGRSVLELFSPYSCWTIDRLIVETDFCD